MDILPKSITTVAESFQKLPGIGPKTAQRLAFYLLHVPDSELEKFADGIRYLKSKTKLCLECKNTTEDTICQVCKNPIRTTKAICVVEQPTDVVAIEKTGKFSGRYHVLHGVIDPLNGIGPDEIFLEQLLQRIAHTTETEEIIIATNPTMEGEATALYIVSQVKKKLPTRTIAITRLAHGLPVGADVNYTDEVTLGRALDGRRSI